MAALVTLLEHGVRVKHVATLDGTTGRAMMVVKCCRFAPARFASGAQCVAAKLRPRRVAIEEHQRASLCVQGGDILAPLEPRLMLSTDIENPFRHPRSNQKSSESQQAFHFEDVERRSRRAKRIALVPWHWIPSLLQVGKYKSGAQHPVYAGKSSWMARS